MTRRITVAALATASLGLAAGPAVAATPNQLTIKGGLQF